MILIECNPVTSETQLSNALIFSENAMSLLSIIPTSSPLCTPVKVSLIDISQFAPFSPSDPSKYIAAPPDRGIHRLDLVACDEIAFRLREAGIHAPAPAFR